MKPSTDDEEIVLSFYCKTTGSFDEKDCPAFHRTDRGTWMVQGERHDGPRVRSQLRAPKKTEGAVEIPDDLADLFARMYVKERYGVDLGGAAERADPRLPYAPES